MIGISININLKYIKGEIFYCEVEVKLQKCNMERMKLQNLF